jgi:hypothetical protein
MSDITIKVLDPPASNALMTLENAKIMLGISAADTTNDAQLQMAIDQNSAVLHSQANRRGYGFGKQKVRETHRCVAPVCCPDGSYRLWLMLWPVMEADIESVESPAGTVLDPTAYELEEQSGKLTIWGGGSEFVVVYSGGFDLPDNAPPDLQFAISIKVRETRTEAAQAAVTGIRMISHESARVMFHSPTQSASSGGTGTAGTAAQKTVQNLLVPYTRYAI